MNYERFEDLPVWKTAAQLYESMDDFLDAAPRQLRPSFRDQIERATLSVSNNIAEGFERGTTPELLSFLYIARGSAGEVRSMLSLLERRPWAAEFKPRLAALKLLAESCSRQLHAWAQMLQNSPDSIGQRRMTDQVRRRMVQRKSAVKFEQKLTEMLPKDHPMRQFREAQMQGKERRKDDDP